MKNNFFLKIFIVALLVWLFNFLIVQIGHSRIDLTSEKNIHYLNKLKIF